MARKVTSASEAIGPAPEPEPVTETTPEQAAQPGNGETPPEPTPETHVVIELPPFSADPPPEPTEKPPLLRLQVNQIQRITFGDGSEYLAIPGIHDINDPDLAKKLTDLINRPNKRQLFIL